MSVWWRVPGIVQICRQGAKVMRPLSDQRVQFGNDLPYFLVRMNCIRDIVRTALDDLRKKVDPVLQAVILCQECFLVTGLHDNDQIVFGKQWTVHPSGTMLRKIDAKHTGRLDQAGHDRQIGCRPCACTRDIPEFGIPLLLQAFPEKGSCQRRTEAVGRTDEQDRWHSTPPRD